MKARLLSVIVTALLLAGTAFAASALKYPDAPRDPKPDNFWGVAVPDPFRWLENVDSAQTQVWVRQEEELSRSYLDAIPARTQIIDSYRKLLNYERTDAPERAGNSWFFFRNSGLQNQSVLYVRDSERGPARELLDPNKLSADGTVALGPEHSFSKDGRYLAYATQSAGSDWETWHVRTVATGVDLADTIGWSKFSYAVWAGDTGFYYSGYDTPDSPNSTLSTLGRQKVWFHRLGSSQSQDKLIYGGDPAQPGVFANVLSTEDERYLFLLRTTISANSLDWRPSGEPDAAYRPLFSMEPNVTYTVIGDDGDRLYVVTNAAAPLGRLAWVNVGDARHALHDIVPQSADKLESVSLIGSRFLLNYSHDAHSLIKIADLSGKQLGAIELPAIGTADMAPARRHDRIAYYTFSSFTFPATVYRYDTLTGATSVLHRPSIAFDGSAYATDLDFATSKDGTKIPVFITHRKDMRLDGSTPTIVYGYGGFGVSLTPQFDPGTALWLQMGGAYAQAVIRGGGEYGEPWHEGGSVENKQNSFDDFIAASEMLIRRGITSTPNLAANGASNGGLLVGAVLTQRPDLYGAAIPEVGVLDMLRYQRWTVAKAWIPEYGSADRSETDFKYLYAFSPDDHVRPGTRYPATLIMTSDHDDRVYPAHSFKFAAQLQFAQAGDAPILLRIESRGGHGFGRPTDKISRTKRIATRSS